MKSEIDNELDKLNKDKEKYLMELSRQQNKFSELLNGEMGEDIKNVTSGKVKVKLSFKEKIKYNLKFIINKIFNTF